MKTTRTNNRIPYAENLLAYIEQRIEESSTDDESRFIHDEYIWMKGYIQALKDYNIKNDIECTRLKHQLVEITQADEIKEIL